MTIKEARKAAGLTQQGMSDLLGIPRRTLENWESGRSLPPEWVEHLVVEKLNRIAKEFPEKNNLSEVFVMSEIKKLRMRDVFTEEGYEALTPEERRHELKIRQAALYSGCSRYDSSCRSLLERIPADWWSSHSAKEIGEVMALLKKAFDDGAAHALQHKEDFE